MGPITKTTIDGVPITIGMRVYAGRKILCSGIIKSIDFSLVTISGEVEVAVLEPDGLWYHWTGELWASPPDSLSMIEDTPHLTRDYLEL